jgi:hypothetical protein
MKSHEGDITTNTLKGDITTKSHEDDITTKLHEGNVTPKLHRDVIIELNRAEAPPLDKQ